MPLATQVRRKEAKVSEMGDDLGCTCYSSGADSDCPKHASEPALATRITPHTQARKANREGYDGYVIVCDKCGEPIHEHIHHDDCALNMRRNRELRAFNAIVGPQEETKP